MSVNIAPFLSFLFFFLTWDVENFGYQCFFTDTMYERSHHYSLISYSDHESKLKKQMNSHMPSCTTPDSYPNDSIPTTKTLCVPVIHTATTVAGRHEITHPPVDEWMMKTSCVLHAENILNHKENIFLDSSGFLRCW